MHWRADERGVDKIEDAKAKSAVRLQILADKTARAEKFAREKALREGKDVPLFAGTSPSSSIAPAKVVEEKKYNQTRLSIRPSAGGAPLTWSGESTTTLGMIRDHVLANGGLEGGVFSSTFPRKIYGEGDMLRSLEELGLSPSAVLILTV